MQRIASRDRPYERNMEREYIDLLNRTYEESFSQPHQDASVLPIDTNLLNIVQNPEHLKYIENRIREKLQLTPFQPSLPLNP
jgi:deoxyguanosine kinase